MLTVFFNGHTLWKRSTLYHLKMNFPLSPPQEAFPLSPWRTTVICYENLHQNQKGKAEPRGCEPLVGEKKLFGEHYNANQQKKKSVRQPRERDLNM